MVPRLRVPFALLAFFGVQHVPFLPTQEFLWCQAVKHLVYRQSGKLFAA